MAIGICSFQSVSGIKTCITNSISYAYQNWLISIMLLCTAIIVIEVYRANIKFTKRNGNKNFEEPKEKKKKDLTYTLFVVMLVSFFIVLTILFFWIIFVVLMIIPFKIYSKNGGGYKYVK